MVNRTKIFCLVVFIWISFEGCTFQLGMQGIDKSTLSSEEIEKVEAVRLIEVNELNESSYKVIDKVHGRSCQRFEAKMGFGHKIKSVEKPSRGKAMEQLKISAMRAGANAITNWVCLFDSSPMMGALCLTWVECQADAIQTEEFGLTQKTKEEGQESVPSPKFDPDCDWC